MSPGHSPCRRPEDSAGWQTAAGCRPRPSWVRCDQDRGRCSQEVARTLKGPLHSGQEVTDLKGHRVNANIR